MMARTSVSVCPVWIWAITVPLKMALPHAWASRWSRWHGRIVPAWLISPGGRAVFMAEVQPRNARDATETASRVFFIVQPFLCGSVRTTGGLTAPFFWRRRGELFSEQDDFLHDRGDLWEKLGRNVGQAVDERLQMGDVAEIVREEMARPFAERFGDLDEVLEVQPALTRLEPRQMRRRDSDVPRD